MTSSRFDALFGGPPRVCEAPITQREMNIAASIQQVTGEIMLIAVLLLLGVSITLGGTATAPFIYTMY